MLEVKSVKTEPEFTPIVSREIEKPMLDNRDMCAFLCIICSALITYLLVEHGLILREQDIQFAGTIISFMFLIALILFWTTQKIVYICYIRAKKKSPRQLGQGLK